MISAYPFSFPQPCVALIHQPQLAGLFDRVEMPGVPTFIVQAALNAVQPLLRTRVHRALVNEGQEGFPWL